MTKLLQKKPGHYARPRTKKKASMSHSIITINKLRLMIAGRSDKWKKEWEYNYEENYYQQNVNKNMSTFI